MTEPSAAVQKAVYDALQAALAASSPVIARVYDHVPQNAAYPYVVMESQQVTQADYLASRMDERFFYLSVWSQYRGQKQVLEIMAAVDAALHRQRLPMTTGQMIDCEVTRKRTSRDADGVTYQGQITLRIRTEH